MDDQRLKKLVLVSSMLFYYFFVHIFSSFCDYTFHTFFNWILLQTMVVNSRGSLNRLGMWVCLALMRAWEELGLGLMKLLLRLRTLFLDVAKTQHTLVIPDYVMFLVVHR